MKINDFLKLENQGLSDVLDALTVAIRGISSAVRTADTGKAGTTNVFGEEQVALDVLSNQILIDELKKTSSVALLASEEMEDEMVVNENGDYGVCFDPLDGSSLVDVNLSVGTIVGVYRLGKEQTFIGKKGREQVASVVAVYGPRTTLFVTVGRGVSEFTLNSDGEFVLSRENLKVAEDGKMFAPGNLRACKYRSEYLDLLNYWVTNEYTLRYSGGMVPDINQILLKGKGVFTYPGYKDQPNGKLRLLYECAPMAFLVEQAGGSATNGYINIQDIEITDAAQQTPIFIGSKKEVEIAESFLSR